VSTAAIYRGARSCPSGTCAGLFTLVLSITLLTMPGFLHSLLILKDRVLGIVFIFSSLSSSMIAFNAALPLALHLCDHLSFILCHTRTLPWPC
jgi:hypothetical protein